MAKKDLKMDNCLCDQILMENSPQKKLRRKPFNRTFLKIDDSIKNCPLCGFKLKSLLKPLIKNGKIVRKLPKPKKIREFVLKIK